MELTVTVPWYPLCLSPNRKRKLHWSAYRKPTKAYRMLCYWLAKEASGRKDFGPIKAVTVSFEPPDALHRDDDNTEGAFKAGRDGIAAALGHDDKTWKGKVTYLHLAPYRPDGRITVKMEFEDGE